MATGSPPSDGIRWDEKLSSIIMYMSGCIPSGISFRRMLSADVVRAGDSLSNCACSEPFSLKNRNWQPKEFWWVAEYMKLNSGLTDAWFSRWSWLKYALDGFIVDTVNPPLIGMNSAAVNMVNMAEVSHLRAGGMSVTLFSHHRSARPVANVSSIATAAAATGIHHWVDAIAADGDDVK